MKYKIKKIFDNSFIKFIMNFIEYLLLFIIGLYLFFVIVQRVGNNKSIFGYRVYTVASSSMEPAYMVNDVVAVKDVDVNTLKVGDDIAYNGLKGGFEGKLVSHRIIKIEQGVSGKVFFTQGINNENPDPSISEAQIVGKVRGKIPVITQLNHLVKNQYGFFFLIFCPLVLVISLEIAETIIRIKIEKEELIDLKKEKNDKIEEIESLEFDENEKSDTIEDKKENSVKSSELKKDVVIDEEIL